MNAIRRSVVALIVVSTLLGGLRAASSEPAAPSSAVESNSAFAFALYAQLCQAEKGNLFFSPASIHAALAMTYTGAKGETAAQMARVLHFPADAKALAVSYGALLETLNSPPLDREKQPPYSLVIANALWGKKGYPYRADFLALSEQHFGAGLKEIDFAQGEVARKIINDWVATQTKDRIKDLIPEGMLNGLTRLLVTNAVYFKNRWAEEFPRHATHDGLFTRLDAKQVRVPLMVQQGDFLYSEDELVQVLELPYSRHALGMVVILPRKADGLPAVERRLDARQVGKWLAGLTRCDVAITLPRFEIEDGFSLARSLKAMGMSDAFVSKEADFSGIATVEDLFILDVLHEAFVEVDEEGTEAAAATAIAGAVSSAPPSKRAEPKIFKADHPFLFLIRHNATGEVLFLGRLMEPAAARTP